MLNRNTIRMGLLTNPT